MSSGGGGAASPNSSACTTPRGGAEPNGFHHQGSSMLDTPKACSFQMPLHYPRYKKADYEKMPEWQLDRLLDQYGFPAAAATGDVNEKRKFAMGAFLWPDQLYE